MSEPHNTPTSLRRGRKLPIALAVFGILFATFAGFLFTPSSGRNSPVELHLEKLVTNTVIDVDAFFLVTNIGPQECRLIGFHSQRQRDGEWSTFAVASYPGEDMTNGESRLVRVGIPADGSKWRTRSLVHIEPTKMQYIRINLFAQLNKILPGAGRSDEASYRSMLRTNYSAEFPR